jgi:hypothetical protein
MFIDEVNEHVADTSLPSRFLIWEQKSVGNVAGIQQCLYHLHECCNVTETVTLRSGDLIWKYGVFSC